MVQHWLHCPASIILRSTSAILGKLRDVGPFTNNRIQQSACHSTFTTDSVLCNPTWLANSLRGLLLLIDNNSSIERRVCHGHLTEGTTPPALARTWRGMLLRPASPLLPAVADRCPPKSTTHTHTHSLTRHSFNPLQQGSLTAGRSLSDCSDIDGIIIDDG